MPAPGSKLDFSIGFLSVQKIADKGFVGGHLVLNSQGRPLEFRCTAPVQPSRAQEVLYGPTLDAYVCGELISDALFTSTKTQPALVFTDSEANMSARNGLKVPLLYLLPDQNDASEIGEATAPVSRQLEPSSATSNRSRWRVDQVGVAAELTGPHWNKFQLGERDVAVSPDFANDEQAAGELWSQASVWIDLAEPFERIRDAIGESLAG